MTTEYARAIVALLVALLGFFLNAWREALRTANARREEDAAYRAHVRAHMVAVERQLQTYTEAMSEFEHFRGSVDAFIRGTVPRLERIERSLDATRH